MGFLSKVFGRTKPSTLQEVAETVELSELEPREQHYMFAHRALPAIARRSPADLLEDLSDPEAADDILRMIWDMAGEELTGRDLVSPDGLSVAVRRFEEFRIGLVTLPPPLGMAEAYFGALVFGSAATSDGEIESCLERYIVLERSFASEEGEPSAVLGEWEEDSHLNYGKGPPPNADAFFARVCEMLHATPDLHARTNFD